MAFAQFCTVNHCWSIEAYYIFALERLWYREERGYIQVQCGTAVRLFGYVLVTSNKMWDTGKIDGIGELIVKIVIFSQDLTKRKDIVVNSRWTQIGYEWRTSKMLDLMVQDIIPGVGKISVLSPYCGHSPILIGIKVSAFRISFGLIWLPSSFKKGYEVSQVLMKAISWAFVQH